MLRGDMAVVSSMIDQIPAACALLSPKGEIVRSNYLFSRVLGLDGAVPEDLDELSRMTGYPLAGPYSEFRITGRVDSRELCSDGGKPGYIAVDIARLAKITPEISSIMILRDISSSKDFERSTEEMLAMVAHELRTPMTGLRNSLRLMLGSGPSCGDGDGFTLENHGITRFLDTALRTVDRLSTLVDGMVDTSSIRSNDRKPDFGQVDTEDFMRDSCRIFSGTFMKKGIGLHLGIAEGAEKMFVDYGMMSQVIQNLVSNSLKNVPSGGRVRIEVSTSTGDAGDGGTAFPGSLLPDARYTRIRIMDTGPGIPEDVAYRINSSEDETEARRTSFKGLGIHISGKLIELHGGRLRARTRDHEGGSIEILVPADRPTSRAVLSVRDSMRAFRRMVSGGSLPVVGIVKRYRGGCWIEAASEWPVPPVILPEEGDAAECDGCLWPVSDGIAIYISSRETDEDVIHAVLPGSSGTGGPICPEGVGCGFARYPADGRKFAELLERAVEEVSAGMIINH